jgi:hypothetical protein
MDGIQEVLPWNAKEHKDFSSKAPKFSARERPQYLPQTILEISAKQPFIVKDIAQIRLVIFKMIKSEFSLNINKNGTILISLKDKAASKKLLITTNL